MDQQFCSVTILTEIQNSTSLKEMKKNEIHLKWINKKEKKRQMDKKSENMFPHLN